ncbi:hypothetical protein [Persicobacter psychrovividus]|uniref:hypothetical protein n=1 Tax=Persicobacter psychrovividus TaxID=387638 RepID=UPI0030CA3136
MTVNHQTKQAKLDRLLEAAKPYISGDKGLKYAPLTPICQSTKLTEQTEGQ